MGVSARAALFLAIALLACLAVGVADQVSRIRARSLTGRLGKPQMKVKAFFPNIRRMSAAPQAVCQDSMRWDQLAWNYMSFQEREDWYALGWTPESWDLAHVDEGGR